MGLTLGFLITTLLFLGGCYGLPEGETEGDFLTSMWPIIIFMVLLFGLMYFVMIRPQRKRQQEQQNLAQELKRGDKVITAGGIYGQVETPSEESVVLKIDSGVTLRIAKSTVAGKKFQDTPKLV